MPDRVQDKPADPAGGEQTAKADVSTGENQAPKKPHASKARKRQKRGLWPFLLLVVAGLGAIGFFVVTEYMDITSLFRGSPPKQQERVESEPLAPPAVKPVAMPATPLPSVSTEEVEALRDSISALRATLEGLREDSAALRKVMAEQQMPDIRARLNWIENPASSLEQVYFAWADIAVASGLADDRRQLAQDMRDTARRHWNDWRSWIATLSQMIGTLASPGEDEVPTDGQVSLKVSFQQWLQENFHLRRSDAEAKMSAMDLSERMTQARAAIQALRWPDADAWGKLLAETRQAGLDVSNLPADFSAIQIDIDNMRAQARDWLEQL